MKSEELVSNHAELFAADYGCYYRNNSGALKDEQGRLIRFGLGNTSAAFNAKIKSSDFIGFTPIIITPEWLGCRVAVFTAFEMKKEAWRFSPKDEHAVAQKAFHDIVLSHGGFAGFVQSNDDILRVIRMKA